MDTNEPMETTAEVSRRLGIPAGTLKRWRFERRGPAYFKMGERGHIRYRRADIDAFIEQQMVDPQAEAS